MATHDDAVSPVIATVLLVAITVVVAGVLFVLAQNLGTSTNSPGNLTFTINDATDRAIVKSTLGDPQWIEVDIRMSADGGWAINGAPASGFTAEAWEPASGGHIFPGEYIDVCLDVPGETLILDVRHVDPSFGVTTLTFTNVGEC